MTVEEARMNDNMGGQWIGNLRGENGDDFFNDTASHTGKWSAFLVWEDCVLTSTTRPKTNNPSYLVGITIDKGTLVYGVFTEITLASGAIQAFLF